MTEDRSQALARLGVFVGEWVVEACFPGQPPPSSAKEEGRQVRSRRSVDAHTGVTRFLTAGIPAAFHRHLQPGREYHQRRMGEVPCWRRMGARFCPHLPQGRLT